jgi:hypothetical protein
MYQTQYDNMKTNYLITPKPIDTDKVTIELNRQYLNLCGFIMFK